jgi:hypothetical protein
MWSTDSSASTPPAASPIVRSPFVLNWRSGDRLTLTAEAGEMVARRDPAAWSPCQPGRTS